jgi:hypothetical protein
MAALCLSATVVNADNGQERDHDYDKLPVSNVKGSLSVRVLGSGGPMASGRVSAR